MIPHFSIATLKRETQKANIREALSVRSIPPMVTEGVYTYVLTFRHERTAWQRELGSIPNIGSITRPDGSIEEFELLDSRAMTIRYYHRYNPFLGDRDRGMSIAPIFRDYQLLLEKNLQVYVPRTNEKFAGFFDLDYAATDFYNVKHSVGRSGTQSWKWIAPGLTATYLQVLKGENRKQWKRYNPDSQFAISWDTLKGAPTIVLLDPTREAYTVEIEVVRFPTSVIFTYPEYVPPNQILDKTFTFYGADWEFFHLHLS